MKLLVAFAILLVGANANILRSPSNEEHVSEDIKKQYSFSELSTEQLGQLMLQHLDDSRFVDIIVVEIIQRIREQIVEAGLDPLEKDRLELEYTLPVTDLLNVNTYVNNLVLAGASDIVINNMDYSILLTRLTFDISLPRLSANIGSSALDVTFFGESLTTALRGYIAIEDIRVQGNVRFSIGIISGISLHSLNIDFTLGGIESHLDLAVQNVNYSEILNNVLGGTIPNAIAENREELNELLEYIVANEINKFLSSDDQPENIC